MNDGLILHSNFNAPQILSTLSWQPAIFFFELNNQQIFKFLVSTCSVVLVQFCNLCTPGNQQ